ncbi:LysR family transcriptional regulator [Pollutimonas harenae]|uniref:LysR family transcriptional regulator n=1 Tax=Pollutimonas harenae TaxID=657015 RepID=A0A853GUG4_9BURK|nr:LysR family transcriptional regulator [Pollutimonas harenae]NYT85911.1 LysR family transcriptional regulator [Pollutimonas harenae]TEA70964.1 LysR family transcriptional regulator [Pollutimonas harenae]
MNLSSRQLRAFVALAQERHFTRAAERCHQTQPAFSALIRSLEDIAGVRLFDRTTRRVELTPEGHLFNESAQRLLNDLDAVMGDIQDHVAKRKGRVAVSALPSLAAGWLPGIYAQFHAQHPGVQLQLHDALLEPCLDMVRRGSVDMAVAAKGRDMSGLLAEPLCEDYFYMVCRDDHPLAQRSAVHLRELKGSAMIQLGKGSSIRQSLARNAVFCDLDSFLEVDHLATVTGLVSAGLGVSLVPAMTLFQFRHEQIKVIPLVPRSRIKRSLYLIRRSEKSLSSAARAFYDVLLDQRSDLARRNEQAMAPGTISAPTIFSISS